MLDVRNKTAWLRERRLLVSRSKCDLKTVEVFPFTNHTSQTKHIFKHTKYDGFDGSFNKSLSVQAHLCLWQTATSVRFTRELLHIYLNHSLTLALVWEHCAAHLSLTEVKMVILLVTNCLAEQRNNKTNSCRKQIIRAESYHAMWQTDKGISKWWTLLMGLQRDKADLHFVKKNECSPMHNSLLQCKSVAVEFFSVSAAVHDWVIVEHDTKSPNCHFFSIIHQ